MIGLEYFEADKAEWLRVTNPNPRFWWLPIWVINLLGLTVTHIVEAD
jgi:hypothetical protein